MGDTTLTLKFKGLEAELLEEMVRLGLFNSKSEAIRAALMKYAVDSGLLSRKDLWKLVRAHKRRKTSPDELERDLQSLEKH
ncbi:MAG: ribbon-helix-helix protein, CopG family [Candidatus Bathyarchaeia archaeon]